jgi:ribosomal protein S18 acetylase RimI-like enzyme
MKTGRVVQNLSLKNGRKAVLRTPKWEDLDDLLDLINSLVEEKADIIRGEKVTRKEEIDFLASVLKRVETKEEFFLIAEVGAKVVTSSEIGQGTGSYDSHVGMIGIVVKDGFRDVGLGTMMMKTLVERGRSMGLKVLTLCAFSTKKRAIHVYEKVGFARTGYIPKVLQEWQICGRSSNDDAPGVDGLCQASR